MSIVRTSVELIPPGHNGTAEHLVSRGHKCGYCHGNGWFWGEDTEHESVKVPCPICKGNKELDAVIDIRWVPTK